MPTHAEIQQQLARILDSPLFASSQRLSRFLRYIVERTCAGESRELKEFLIGTEVFDRDERFDPRLDSLVRVEAGRLRSRLIEYYSGHGSQDPLIIRVPKGGYVPVFEARLEKPSIAGRLGGATLEAVSSSPLVASPRARQRAVWSTAAALLVALIGGIAFTAFRPVRSTAEVSVVVVAFPTLSEQNDLPHLTRSVSRELARLGTVQVISHASVAE